MGARLTELTRGCRTTELFWEGQERLPGREAGVPLQPGVCSYPPGLRPGQLGQGRAVDACWLEPTPLHGLTCCS